MDEWWYASPDNTGASEWDQFWALADRETIGEWIGLKDKNEREIFEGDIVRRMSGGLLGDGKQLYTGVVEFINLSYVAKYYQKHLAGTEHEEAVEHHGHIANTRELEVIGNLVDNPELLKL